MASQRGRWQTRGMDGYPEEWMVNQRDWLLTRGLDGLQVGWAVTRGIGGKPEG